MAEAANVPSDNGRYRFSVNTSVDRLGKADFLRSQRRRIKYPTDGRTRLKFYGHMTITRVNGKVRTNDET